MPLAKVIESISDVIRAMSAIIYFCGGVFLSISSSLTISGVKPANAIAGIFSGICITVRLPSRALSCAGH